MQHRSGVMALILCLLLARVGIGRAETDTSEGRARSFFTRFVELGQALDPALADLYADNARIVSIRKYSGGGERTIGMSGVEYKALIRQLMPGAKARGDTNSYADVSYRREGSRIWVEATRYSALKQYSSPYAVLVGPDGSGQWLIYEERSITRP